MKPSILMSMLCLIGMACSKSKAPVPSSGAEPISLNFRDTLSGLPIDSVQVFSGRGRLRDHGYAVKSSFEIPENTKSLFWFSKPGYQLHSQTIEKSATIYLKPYIPFRLHVETGSLQSPIWLYGSFNESPAIIQNDTILELSHAAMSWVTWRYEYQGQSFDNEVFLKEENQKIITSLP